MDENPSFKSSANFEAPNFKNFETSFSNRRQSVDVQPCLPEQNPPPPPGTPPHAPSSQPLPPPPPPQEEDDSHSNSISEPSNNFRVTDQKGICIFLAICYKTKKIN
jgi:hypothetical protein